MRIFKVYSGKVGSLIDIDLDRLDQVNIDRKRNMTCLYMRSDSDRDISEHEGHIMHAMAYRSIEEYEANVSNLLMCWRAA